MEDAQLHEALAGVLVAIGTVVTALNHKGVLSHREVRECAQATLDAGSGTMPFIRAQLASLIALMELQEGSPQPPTGPPRLRVVPGGRS